MQLRQRNKKSSLKLKSNPMAISDFPILKVTHKQIFESWSRFFKSADSFFLKQRMINIMNTETYFPM